MGELATGRRMIRVGMPLVNAICFIRVVDVSELVIDSHGLDFVLLADGRGTERSESTDKSGGDAAGAGIEQTVLPQVTVARSLFGRHDCEDRLVSLAPVETDAHRRSSFAFLIVKDGN